MTACGRLPLIGPRILSQPTGNLASADVTLSAEPLAKFHVARHVRQSSHVCRSTTPSPAGSLDSDGLAASLAPVT